MNDFNEDSLNETIEDLFGRYEGRALSASAVADVKEQVRTALVRKKRRVVILRALSTAAVFLILASIIATFDLKEEPARLESAMGMTDAVWESENVIDDPEIAALFEEIDFLAEQLYSIELDAGNGIENAELLDIETEAIELQSDFWEG